MINIPTQAERKWVQTNNSDLFGNLFVTKNITFDREGYLELSGSPREAMNGLIDTDFSNPCSFTINEDYGFFVPTWDNAFSVNSDSTAGIFSARPTQITTTGVPATDIETDSTWFNGLMPVSQDTDLDYYNPSDGTWTDTNITLTANGQHQVVNLLSLNALAVVDVNTIKLYSAPLTATPTLITTLTIPSDFEITSVCYLNQNLYIGTQNVYGGNAFMFVWNGVGTAAQQAYEIDSPTILSLTPHQSTIFLLSSSGALLKFIGGGFDQIAAFPCFYTDQNLTDQLGNINMYKNVMKSNGDILYILFNGDEQGLLNQPDGVWCYDERVGLYHRYSLSCATTIVEDIIHTGIDVTTNILTVANDIKTGTEVVYLYQSEELVPLVSGTKYFTIRVDATHIKLATTLANALAGTAIDLISVTAGTRTFIFFPNVDYGAFYTARTMALGLIQYPVDNRLMGTDILWGAEVTRRTLSGDDASMGSISYGVEARGYFITPKIFSQNITDVFNLITLKFSPFVSELDKIIIKYRVTDDRKEKINTAKEQITWTSSTTFTTTADWSGAVVGNEVEVLRGAGAGLLAHITEITSNSGTYTVTIDETFGEYASNDKSVAVYRNWKKWKTVVKGDNDELRGYISEQLGKTGKFLQLKIELRGVGVRIEELLVDNKYHLPSKN